MEPPEVKEASRAGPMYYMGLGLFTMGEVLKKRKLSDEEEKLIVEKGYVGFLGAYKSGRFLSLKPHLENLTDAAANALVSEDMEGVKRGAYFGLSLTSGDLGIDAMDGFGDLLEILKRMPHMNDLSGEKGWQAFLKGMGVEQ